ncbi:DNA topoisomerase 3 [Paraburkholderia nemoris]|uniref:DNA topoisomerase n=1 Tax=Paraburkholderia nemoris TaxID=2793076 RepID=UPI00190C97B0|nr:MULTISPECIES: DNA topoisomerase [Paraburkholderia]MBK3786068.1 DNA topoisomerase [Paraburkholderia aspalathi]CAE6846713.1 DNA topoisomerase 3 [Paraburkholderia nemoris]
MSRLFISEKPSLAEAVARFLPGTVRKEGAVTYVGEDAFVPLAGHALAQAMPDAYLPDDVPLNKNGKKVWREQDLPVVPATWIMEPEERLQRNLSAIEKLLKTVDEVVHLGDPEPEGQLIVDEVLNFYGNRKPVIRLLVNDYNETKVRQALASMRSNDEPEFRAWYRWAYAQSHYNWLFGLNLTRAATLRARALGYDGALTVGSVQTPALKIVYDRDRAIETFRQIPYFTMTARIEHANGPFVATWKAGEEQAGLDEAKRLVDGAVAQALAQRLAGQAATIADFDKAERKEGAPLPMSLNELTVAACTKFGCTGAEVLEAAQVLYALPLQLTTYPRTEVRHLSEAQHADAPEILAALAKNLPAMQTVIDGADPSVKSAAFNDKKVDGTSHHGIVPTVAVRDLSGLTPLQRNVYDMIVRSYLAQFYPSAVFMQTKIEVHVDGERFTASGKTPVSPGWREVYAPVDAGSSAATTGEDAEGKQQLPVMTKGDTANCATCDLQSRETKAPERFDESSLLEAMIDLHKYTTDPAAKARLKEGKGIGTSATRAGIIAELRERGFLEPVKGTKSRFMVSRSGRGLLDALPDPVKNPTMAGMFKIALDGVAAGEVTYEQFIDRSVAFITKVIEQLRTAKMNLPVASTVQCPKCRTGQLRRLKGEKGAFWGCSNYQAEPKCAASFPDQDGKPDFQAKPKAKGKGFGFKKAGAA